MNGGLLDVQALTVRYGGIEALTDFSLVLQEGQTMALIGANGAGKSSALKAIAGGIAATGQLCFSGQDIGRLPAWQRARAGLMLVPEGRGIFARLSIEENLSLGRALGRQRVALDPVYDRFPRLAERRYQLAGTLSGGEQQLLALGRVMLARPRLLLLDEPSMGLAPQRVDEVYEAVSDMVSEGMTLLLVEQNAERALGLCPRVMILESGRTVFSGSSADCRASSRLRAAYLGGEDAGAD